MNTANVEPQIELVTKSDLEQALLRTRPSGCVFAEKYKEFQEQFGAS